MYTESLVQSHMLSVDLAVGIESLEQCVYLKFLVEEDCNFVYTKLYAEEDLSYVYTKLNVE